MQFTPADSGSLIGFIIIVIGVIAAFLVGIYKSSTRLKRRINPVQATLKALLSVILWLSLFGGIVASGVLELHPMPGIPIFFGIMNLGAIAFGLSPIGLQLARGLSLQALVGFQAFRLPLEVVLHSWAIQGTIPETMTWTGQNFDIFTGMMATLTIPFANRWRQASWAMNIVGIVLLLNVIRVAIFSSPLPFAWPVHPPLLLGLHFPYFLIAPVCVTGAIAGHIILTRALLLKNG